MTKCHSEVSEIVDTKVIVVLASGKLSSTWPPSIQMGVTAGIFLASILLKEMRYLVYIRYLWYLSFHKSTIKSQLTLFGQYVKITDNHVYSRANGTVRRSGRKPVARVLILRNGYMCKILFVFKRFRVQNFV